MTTLTPAVRALGRDEIDALLGRNHVGRLAYALGNRVDVEPVSYVYEAPWIYAQTRPGMDPEMIRRLRFVTFEVDEVESGEEWREVTVRGAFYRLAAGETLREKEAFERAHSLLDPGARVPAPSGEHAFHPIVFRLPAYHAVGCACELVPGLAG